MASHYVCFWAASFRLQAARRLQREHRGRALALVDESGRIVELDVAARAQGIVEGMDLAKAMGREQGLKVLHRSPSAERGAARLMWQAAWQLSPQVEPTRPGCLTLQVPSHQPSEVLAEAVGGVMEHLRQSDLYTRAASAPTPQLAELAAIAGESLRFKHLRNAERVRQFLEAQLLTLHPAIDAKQAALLEGWGIRSLGQMARLPRQALSERLGKDFATIWDDLNARQPRPLRFATPEPDYRESYDLEEPLEHLEGVLFLLGRAAEALELQLRMAGKLARSLTLELRIESGLEYRKQIRLPEATRHSGLLLRVMGQHLENVPLDGPVCAASLAVEPVAPLHRQSGLFESSLRNPWRLTETLDQLSGLLGEKAFGQPARRDTHRPDAFCLTALAEELSPWTPPQGPPLMGPRLRRFRPPLPVAVSYREEKPVALNGGPRPGKIVQASLPEAGSGDWWTERPWGGTAWDIEILGGGLFRVYRDFQGQSWLEGVYD